MCVLLFIYLWAELDYENTPQHSLDKFSFLCTNICFILPEWTLSLPSDQTVPVILRFLSDQLFDKNFMPRSFLICSVCFCYTDSNKVFFYCIQSMYFIISVLALHFDFHKTTISVVSLDGFILLMCS